MKFSSKYRSKKLGMTYIILESFCSFLNWEEADIRPKYSLGKSLCTHNFFSQNFIPSSGPYLFKNSYP